MLQMRVADEYLCLRFRLLGETQPFVVLGRKLVEHVLAIEGYCDFALHVQSEGWCYVVVPGSYEQLMKRLMGDVRGD